MGVPSFTFFLLFWRIYKGFPRRVFQFFFFYSQALYFFCSSQIFLGPMDHILFYNPPFFWPLWCFFFHFKHFFSTPFTLGLSSLRGGFDPTTTLAPWATCITFFLVFSCPLIRPFFLAARGPPIFFFYWVFSCSLSHVRFFLEDLCFQESYFFQFSFFSDRVGKPAFTPPPPIFWVGFSPLFELFLGLFPFSQ